MPAPAESPLDQALGRAGDGAFVISADGRIVLWNRAAERILGYGPRDVLGRPCCDVFIGSDNSGNRLCYQGCHVQTLVKMGEPIQSFDMHTRTKAGKPVWISVSILSTPANGKAGPMTVHLFRDVTATRELLELVHERLAAPAGGGERAPAARARGAPPHDGGAQHRGGGPAAAREPGHDPQPRAEHLRQARRAQPPRGGRVLEQAPPALAQK